MSEAKYSATLFDLDGTLVDSLTDIAAAMNHVLTRRGLPPHPEAAYNRFVGDGMAVLARRCLPSSIDAACSLIEDMVADMKHEYAGRWRNHTTPYPDIPELLTRLRERKILLGVLSNKPHAFTGEVVSHLFPDVPFDIVRGAQDGVPVKPAPDAVLSILDHWHLTPRDVLYVGDTDTDIQTALNVGMTSVGVTWGFRDRRELSQAGADHLIDRPLDLLELIR